MNEQLTETNGTIPEVETTGRTNGFGAKTYTPKFKKQMAFYIMDTESTYKEVSEKTGICRSALSRWCKRYKAAWNYSQKQNGETTFSSKPTETFRYATTRNNNPSVMDHGGRKSYSDEFKEKCCEYMRLNPTKALSELEVDLGVPNATLSRWRTHDRANRPAVAIKMPAPLPGFNTPMFASDFNSKAQAVEQAKKSVIAAIHDLTAALTFLNGY